MNKREIKFRGWCNPKMYEVRSLRGDGSAWQPNEDGAEWLDSVAHPLMQFIGIHDENGNEIYEGDIVRLTILNTAFNKKHFDISSLVKTGVIRWYDDGLNFEVQFEPREVMHPIYEHLQLSDSDVEVIGNIHQNPELLKP